MHEFVPPKLDGYVVKTIKYGFTTSFWPVSLQAHCACCMYYCYRCFQYIDRRQNTRVVTKGEKNGRYFSLPWR